MTIYSGLSEKALQAIIGTYRYFSVGYVSDSEGYCYRVRGYKSRFARFLGEGDDLCHDDSMSDAWELVFVLRNLVSGQSLNQQLRDMGIQCSMSPEEGGDVYG